MSDGPRILLVEDEYMIAEDMAYDLRSLGAEVVGPIPTLERALDAVTTDDQLDGAVLDINLGGKLVFPLADELRKKHVPILFTTGYDERSIPPDYADIERCEKPVHPARLRRVMASTFMQGR